MVVVKDNIMETNFFKWETIFETGIEKIDNQHKVIIRLLNELYKIILDENGGGSIDNVINELVQYTDYHFGEEEKLFAKYKYIEEEQHKLEHQKFIDKINNIVKNEIKSEDFVAIELLNFLKDWLLEHIMVSDQKYAVFFNDNNIQIDEADS